MRRNERLAKRIKKTGDSCEICGGLIDFNAPVGSPLAPESDHVVPLARGGVDSLTNLQLVHCGCNRKKGAKVGGELNGVNESDVQVWL